MARPAELPLQHPDCDEQDLNADVHRQMDSEPFPTLARRGRMPATLRSLPLVVTHTPHHEPAALAGDVLTAISDGMVALLKEYYGRGPMRTKSYYHDDLVVCVLRGGFSRVEQTLLDGGRGTAVIQQRMEFQELMRERFEAVIESATGRRVIGFMSGNQQDPDLMCEVFILAPTDLVDEHESGQRAASRRGDATPQVASRV